MGFFYHHYLKYHFLNQDNPQKTISELSLCSTTTTIAKGGGNIYFPHHSSILPSLTV